MGAPELLIVLAIVLLLFGASRLPKLGRAVGEARRELRTTTDANGKGQGSPSA